MKWVMLAAIVFFITIVVVILLPTTLHVCSAPAFCVNLPDPNAAKMKMAVMFGGFGIAATLAIYGAYEVSHTR
jgi:hypothetical protein